MNVDMPLNKKENKPFIDPIRVVDWYYGFIYCYFFIGLVGSVRQWSGRPGFNPRSRHSKDFKNGT